ncbi:MAG: indolepyruvate oxidoreductase subunit beta [Thermoplasmata archaeon]
MPESEFSVYMAGVGGQGLVLLSNVIGSACAAAGIRAITGEQHGLSQRSGSINVHLRIGERVRSPLIPVGGADAILALEALEALRYVEYLRRGGVVLMNSRVQHPVIETAAHMKDRSARYMSAEDVRQRLSKVTDKIAVLDALAIARQAGNPLTENIVMLGALSTLEAFPVPEEALRMAVAETVPKKAVEVNLRAFELGKAAAREMLCNMVKCRD